MPLFCFFVYVHEGQLHVCHTPHFLIFTQAWSRDKTIHAWVVMYVPLRGPKGISLSAIRALKLVCEMHTMKKMYRARKKALLFLFLREKIP